MKKPPCRCNSNLISSPQPGKPSDGLVVGWCDTRWWTNYVVYMSTPGGHEKKNIWSGHPDCSEEKLSFDKVLISLRMVGYKIWNMKECRTRTPRGICQKLFFPIKSRAILELGRSRVVNLVVYRRICFELSNTVLVLIINMHNTNFCALVIMKYVDKWYWSNSGIILRSELKRTELFSNELSVSISQRDASIFKWRRTVIGGGGGGPVSARN